MKDKLLVLQFLSLAKSLYQQASAHYQTVELHRGQPFLINILRKQDGLTLLELSGKLGSTGATVSKMVTRMEQTGYVKRKPDRDDSRKSRIYLTEKGKSMGQTIDSIHTALNGIFCDPLSDQEREALADILEKVQKNLDNKDTTL